MSGTILGTVKDTTGAAVPGAAVTLLQPGTGFSRTVVSDSKGEYTARTPFAAAKRKAASRSGSAARSLAPASEHRRAATGRRL